MLLSLLEPAASLPVSVDEAKAHARVEVDDDDALIQAMIGRATEHAEFFTERAILTQQWEMTLDFFPYSRVLEVPRPPLISVDSITYLDSAGVEQTFDASNYRVIAPRGPQASKGRVILNNAASWPSTSGDPACVFVRFTAGYDEEYEATAVPEGIKTAIKMHVAEQYENRENSVLTGAVMQEVPFSVRQQLWDFIVDKVL